MCMYKRYSDKTKYMYFTINDANIFDWEKVSNIIKK